MPNPLLKPNDPRFQKPLLSEGVKNNPFAEVVAESSDKEKIASVYVPASLNGDPQPYTPAYAAQQTPRFQQLFLLGSLGWCAAVIGAVSFTGIFDIGWLAPLLGLGPAAAAWLLAHEDIKAIRVGAIRAEAYPPTRYAFWLGLTALLACAGIVGAMIYREMNFLPDVF